MMKLVPRSKRIPSQIYPVELGGWPGWYVRGILFFYFERHKTLAGSVLHREMEIECLFIIVYNSGGKRGEGGQDQDKRITAVAATPETAAASLDPGDAGDAIVCRLIDRFGLIVAAQRTNEQTTSGFRRVDLCSLRSVRCDALECFFAKSALF